MKRKSNPVRDRRISATAASREFSLLLDQIEAGKQFLVHRHGKDICWMAPPPVRGRRASQCIELLRSRPGITLDEGFGADLIDVISGEPIEERPSWGS